MARDRPDLPEVPQRPVTVNGEQLEPSHRSQQQPEREVEAPSEHGGFKDRNTERANQDQRYPEARSTAPEFATDSAASAHGAREIQTAAAEGAIRTSKNLPAPRVESTRIPLSAEMETRLTGRSNYSPPSSLRSGKVPYVEFVAKGKVVSSLGPLPAETARQERETGLPSTPSTVESSGERSRPQDATRATPVSQPTLRVEKQELRPADNSVAAGRPASMIAPAIASTVASAAAMYGPPNPLPKGSTVNQESNRHAPTEDARARQSVREADNSINIKRIDIQIVNDEPRVAAQQYTPVHTGDAIFANLDRHYIREVI